MVLFILILGYFFFGWVIFVLEHFLHISSFVYKICCDTPNFGTFQYQLKSNFYSDCLIWCCESEGKCCKFSETFLKDTRHNIFYYFIANLTYGYVIIPLPVVHGHTIHLRYRFYGSCGQVIAYL
jgi:hypothetical protein